MLFCGRFLGLCATKTVIFGDTRTGSKRAVWLQQDALLGKERWRIQFPIDTFLKKSFKTQEKPYSGREKWRFLYRACCCLTDDGICRYKILWRTDLLGTLGLSQPSWDQSDRSAGRCFFLAFWICMLDKDGPYPFTPRTCDTRTLQVQESIGLHIKGRRQTSSLWYTACTKL